MDLILVCNRPGDVPIYKWIEWAAPMSSANQNSRRHVKEKNMARHFGSLGFIFVVAGSAPSANARDAATAGSRGGEAVPGAVFSDAGSRQRDYGAAGWSPG